MIHPVPSKQDWFYIDEPQLKVIQHLPGGNVLLKKRSIIHRSMLPLLDSDEAEQARLTQPNQTWAAREKWAADRGFKFRVTQQQALDYIEPRRGVLVGDDMRLGKTLTALASHDPARGQLVIVAPLSTRAVWIGWAKRLFPELEIGICTGKKFDPAIFDKPIVFAHYDIISKWQSLRPIGTLVFDEAHFLTNRKTDRTNAAVLLQSRAEKVLALTGTPIWNMPPNLWAVAGLVAPAAFGGYHDFGNRYGRPEQTGYGTIYTGSSNEAELNARMTEIMIRRLWKDCAQDLPPISRGVLVSEVSDVERKKLDILAGALKAERGKSNTQSNLAAYIRQVSTLKVKFAVPEIVKVLNRGEPIVVWTWHKDAADQLKGLLGDRAEVIHGDIAVPERELRMATWKTSTTPKALIATMSVAQVGIDLSHAHIAMFVEIYYIPAIIGQAEMRTFDASRAMDVTFVVANHLIDQRMVRALVSKLGAQDSLGVGAACDAIDSLRDAMFGAQETGDLDRLLQDLLESAA